MVFMVCFFDRLIESVFFDRSMTFSFQERFHAPWGAVPLLECGVDSSMFHAGPRPVENVLNVRESHELDPVTMTITNVWREYQFLGLSNCDRFARLPYSPSHIKDGNDFY